MKILICEFQVLSEKRFCIISRSTSTTNSTFMESILLVQVLQTIQFSVKVCTSYLKMASQEQTHHIKFASHRCFSGLIVLFLVTLDCQSHSLRSLQLSGCYTSALLGEITHPIVSPSGRHASLTNEGCHCDPSGHQGQQHCCAIARLWRKMTLLVLK